MYAGTDLLLSWLQRPMRPLRWHRQADRASGSWPTRSRLAESPTRQARHPRPVLDLHSPMWSLRIYRSREAAPWRRPHRSSGAPLSLQIFIHHPLRQPLGISHSQQLGDDCPPMLAIAGRGCGCANPKSPTLEGQDGRHSLSILPAKCPRSILNAWNQVIWGMPANVDL
jgi:hypothetical protein